MKKYFTLFVLTLIFNSSPAQQYIPASPYINNPELAIGYADSCAAFWLQTWDDNTGGFFTNIDKYGNVITSWGTNKNMLTQTRNAYGLTRAYMLTGDTTYLFYAKRALNWMYNHAWDNNYGGWIQELNSSGNPVNPSSDKTAFYQHYAMLGIAAYFEATRDTTAWNWLMKSYQHLEDNFWDARPGFEGYYDLTNYDASNPRNKSFNATVDAVTTHLLYLYLMTREEKYKTRLFEIADEMVTRLAGSMPQQAIGFVEHFDSDWNWNNSETMTLMGHVLKTGWCLGRINNLFYDTTYINSAERLVNNVLQKGYDHEYGGPYKDFNRTTGQMLLWGLGDSAKAWWQMEQAITAGLLLYNSTGNFNYLRMADQTTNFYMRYFVDHVNGEVYADRKRRGGIAWNEAKGNSGKSAYHSIETGYYLYLYGSQYHRLPFTLNYNIDPLPYEREIILTPIAESDYGFSITGVELNGFNYPDFNGALHTLRIPAGTGGSFAVTYQTIIVGIAESDNSPRSFNLMQNYPNPFNPITSIKYSTGTTSHTELKVYDVLGNEVAELISEVKAPGTYEVKFDASRLSSGVYFYRLTSGSFNQVRKMILIK